jgi:hypothetical protein
MDVGVLAKRSLAAAAAASLLVLVGSACGGDSGPDAIVGGAARSDEISAKDFDPANFDRSATVDNKWFPLRPGTVFVYEGSTVEDGERIPHRAIFTVTDLVKVIDGVRNIVIWDRDYRAGELVEAELSLFAQDNDANVWHLGEYPEEYEEGKLTATPAWFHGIKGARAGITMKAKPRLGAPSYSQGFAPPPVSWVDRGKPYKLGQTTCVPAGCYRDVLIIREFEPDKPQASQLKFYAPGLGIVRVGWLGKRDQDREILELLAVRHLGPTELAQARAEALKLETRAYRVNKQVYGRTVRSTRLNPKA